MASTQKTPPAHRRPRRPRRNGELVVGITIVAVLIAGGTVATIAPPCAAVRPARPPR